MFTLQVGYPVRNYDEWMVLFDKDPIGRAASGARSYRVFRDADDRNYVVVHLDFDTKDAAAAFLERLRDLVWNTPDVMAPLLTGSPAARILEEAGGRFWTPADRCISGHDVCTRQLWRRCSFGACAWQNTADIVGVDPGRSQDNDLEARFRAAPRTKEF